MRKVLVIEDWEKFLKKLYPSDQKLLKRTAKDHELKDVVKFETLKKTKVELEGGKRCG